MALHDPLGERPGSHDPALSTRTEFRPEHDDAHQYENEGERTGGRHLEHVELGEDLGREGLVGEYLERSVLGEDHECDQQTTTQDGAPCLAEGDTEERLQPADTEAARNLLEARVRASQACGYRQVYERIDSEGHHEHGASESLHPGP